LLATWPIYQPRPPHPPWLYFSICYLGRLGAWGVLGIPQGAWGEWGGYVFASN
jgi:hypothetical protein